MDGNIIQFRQFPKIPRYRREVCLTEKIDGTNAAIQIRPFAEYTDGSPMPIAVTAHMKDAHGVDQGPYGMWAQSRQQFITQLKDNYGFARWVADHSGELFGLGEGTHFGEWWGYGIQRGYGMPEKCFSLFNVARYQPGRDTPPACCRVVPLIGYFTPDQIAPQLELLRTHGSYAAFGYQRPEGIIIWHTQSKQYYKILVENDDVPKALAV